MKKRPMDTRTLVEKGTSVVRKLQNAGFIAYFAGGCVRDMLLDISPKDVDIATSAVPEEVQNLFPRTLVIGAQFGVVQVRYGGEGFEVATFREDGTYQDGRRPDSVRFADAKADVLRRDFTINGLLWDPIAEQLFDFVGGQTDLETGILRAIGDPLRRFEEDRLRMLRAIRFATRFAFPIEGGTWEAIRELAPSILTVSAERIRDEVFRTLSHKNRIFGIDLLFRSSLLHILFPQTWIHSEGDLRHLNNALVKSELNDPLQIVFLLLYLEKTEVLEEWGQRWTLSNQEKTTLLALRDLVDAVATLSPTDIPGIKRLVRAPHWDKTCGVLESLEILVPGRWPNYRHLLEISQNWTPEDLNPPPLLTGYDLQHMGLKPGPLFKELLTALETEQLAGSIVSQEQARKWVQEQVAETTREK